VATKRIIIGVRNSGGDFHLRPGKNLFTGIKYFTDAFSTVNSLEEDMFNVAAGVYAADLCVLREEREHYIRNIELTIEVVNLHALQLVKSQLESALFTVSRDNWTLHFVQKHGTATTDFNWTNDEGAVLLFSGGIDSMAAAAHFLEEGKNLVLVSHNSHGNAVIDNCQNNVFAAVTKHYNQTVKHFHIKVYGRKLGAYSFPEERENTQRTRSFLFLTLATLVARRSGFNKILYMAENGQFAIHLPLNQARVGPFSTHTADPQFVREIESTFRSLFNNPDFRITNPFLYKTKAEVFALMPKALQNQVNVSASCWKISHVPGYKHCGFCIPCISRRIAIEYNNIAVNEYHCDLFKTDINSLKDDDDKKRNLIDYLEFVSRFKNLNTVTRNALLYQFPELYNDAFDAGLAIQMYERVSQQSFEVFRRYPQILTIAG